MIVVDSYGGNEILKDIFNESFPIVKTNMLVKTIKYYLKNEKERQKIEEDSYNYLKNNFKTEKFIGGILDVISKCS